MELSHLQNHQYGTDSGLSCCNQSVIYEMTNSQSLTTSDSVFARYYIDNSTGVAYISKGLDTFLRSTFDYINKIPFIETNAEDEQVIDEMFARNVTFQKPIPITKRM